MAEKRRKAEPQKKGNSNRKKPEKEPVGYRDEIILVLTLAVSLLLLLSYFNLIGVVGRLLSSFVFGIFGVLSYPLPVFLFLGVSFAISNRENHKLRKILVLLALGLLLFLGICQLISTGYDPANSLGSYYVRASESHTGGGWIGGFLVWALGFLMGEVGTWIVFLTGIFVILVMLTGKQLLLSLGRKGGESYASYREKRRLRKEEEKNLPQEEKTEPKRKTLFSYDPEKATEQMQHVESSQQVVESVPLSYEQGVKTELGMQEILPEEEKKDTGSLLSKMNFTIHNTQKAAQKKDEPEDETEEAKEEINSVPAAAPVEVFTPGEEVLRERVKIPKDHSSRQEEEKVGEDISSALAEEKIPYVFPPLNLLSKPKNVGKGVSDAQLKETALKLQQTLSSFGVKVSVTNVSCGPSVTRYELQPEQGVKVSRITALTDDIKLNLQATDIRIEAPIPGKAAVGIEVPNAENSTVMLRSLLESDIFRNFQSDVAFAVGKDIGGQIVVTDIAKMPHLLIAGATGSGKSVCINTIVMSILYKADPDDVKLIMVDPKVVELSVYNGIPHLLIPVVTDPKKASGALNWAVAEMVDRYKRFADLGVRDVKGYNAKIEGMTEEEKEEIQGKKMPQIVIIVDELADLMMVAPGEVEDAICRLAQMARAAGLHLIIATQRPSVNVITGLIKANIPSRIAFAVSSAIDSRTILDGGGAEKLLGKGDMLFFPSGYPKPVRVQGAFVSDKEVGAVVAFLGKQKKQPTYSEEINEKITSATPGTKSPGAEEEESDDGKDEYFAEAGRFIIQKEKASIGMLQRVYRIGFNRAARIMDQLAEAGVVGPEEGTKPRKILMTLQEFETSLGGSIQGEETTGDTSL